MVTFILNPFADCTVPGDIAPHIKTVPQTKPCSLFELQLISTLDTILLYKSAATWLQALEGVVDEATEHVSLLLLHQCGPGVRNTFVTAIRKTKPRMKKPWGKWNLLWSAV